MNLRGQGQDILRLHNGIKRNGLVAIEEILMNWTRTFHLTFVEGVSYIPKSLLRIGQMVAPDKKHWETPWGVYPFSSWRFFMARLRTYPEF